MPFVQVTLLEGRSGSQKAAMASGITEVISRVACVDPSGVTVIFTDVNRGDWSKGGSLVADLEQRP